jgi:peptidoglycan/LPS O-acetylase OafA/YrhL
MAIGGIGAYFLFTEHRALKVLINKSILNVCLLAIPSLVYFTPAKIQDGIHLLYSVIFLIVILNVSKGKVKINLENKVLNYLGTISYGIYMYHFMFIPLVLYVLNDFLNLRSGLLMNVILYSSSIILSIGISALSFEFFEKKFIRLKSKFSFVQSGKNL